MRTSLLALLLAACTTPVVVPGSADDGAFTVPGADPGACEALAPAPEGDFLARGTVVSAWRPACAEGIHAAAGAKGSTLAVHLDAWAGPGLAEVTMLDLLGQPLAGPRALAPGESLPVSLRQSGEVLVHVRPEAPEGAGNDYALSVACTAGCDLEYTRYPIVLFHGAAPGDVLGLVDYFNGVQTVLEGRGYLVITPEVDPFASIEERSAQWADHLDGLLTDGVGRKFDVIGHSQGGLDARYIVSRLGYADHVAAVVTVATPHRGSAVADLAAGILDPTPLGQAIVDGVADDVAGLLGLPPQDAMGAIGSLNTEAMARFDAETPDAPGVYYASWAGHSCGILEPGCIAREHGEIVTPLLGATYTLLEATDGANDGMVPVSSAKWGDYRGEIPADHLDEVGQIGDTRNPAFDHRAFYLSQARRLAAMGL